jgi:hypothetical protein
VVVDAISDGGADAGTSSAPSAGSPADARVAIVAVARVVAMRAITRGLFRIFVLQRLLV